MDNKRLSILVADGSDRLRDFFRETLEAKGYETLPAQTGREAIEVIRAEPVHIVVMDVRLPDYSGYEIYHAIKSIRHAFLPCIFTAVEMTARSIQDALDQDAITILPKPVDIERLVHAVGWSVRKYYTRRLRPPFRPGQGRSPLS